jgi:phosphoribosylaminoimidazole-succinocarboxamide synthase
MLIKTGSVKDIYKKDSDYVFKFSNRYSIFDWGQMPDELDEKGSTLAFMAWFFFDYLGKSQNWVNMDLQIPEANKTPAMEEVLNEFKTNGLIHHGLGMCDEDGKILNPTSDKITPFFRVTPVQIIEPGYSEGKWDYTEYTKRPERSLVPLEVIFRFGAPAGSSLFKRLGDENYKKELGITGDVTPGSWFDFPVIEFSTKLETTDKYLNYAEAKEIAGMTQKEVDSLVAHTQIIALALKHIFSQMEIELWDGKLEYAFATKKAEGERHFMLVDSIGPDELRLSLNKSSLSKENLRMFYRDSDWHLSVEKAKDLASQRKEKDWKNICINELEQTPGPLSSEFKAYAESIYTGMVNEIGSKFLGVGTLFKDAKSLDQVATFFKKD